MIGRRARAASSAMPDLLVNLLKLPPVESSTAVLNKAGVTVRRAQPFEITPVRDFITSNFSASWADEISVGFAAYECTRKAFFGPTGVADAERGRGIGKALLIASLWGLQELGYVYGIIGAAGPVEFYQQAVGATLIPDSEPGIYFDLLKQQ